MTNTKKNKFSCTVFMATLFFIFSTNKISEKLFASFSNQFNMQRLRNVWCQVNSQYFLALSFSFATLPRINNMYCLPNFCFRKFSSMCDLKYFSNPNGRFTQYSYMWSKFSGELDSFNAVETWWGNDYRECHKSHNPEQKNGSQLDNHKEMQPVCIHMYNCSRWFGTYCGSYMHDSEQPIIMRWATDDDIIQRWSQVILLYYIGKITKWRPSAFRRSIFKLVAHV